MRVHREIRTVHTLFVRRIRVACVFRLQHLVNVSLNAVARTRTAHYPPLNTEILDCRWRIRQETKLDNRRVFRRVINPRRPFLSKQVFRCVLGVKDNSFLRVRAARIPQNAVDLLTRGISPANRPAAIFKIGTLVSAACIPRVIFCQQRRVANGRLAVKFCVEGFKARRFIIGEGPALSVHIIGRRYRRIVRRVICRMRMGIVKLRIHVAVFVYVNVVEVELDILICIVIAN